MVIGYYIVIYRPSIYCCKLDTTRILFIIVRNDIPKYAVVENPLELMSEQ